MAIWMNVQRAASLPEIMAVYKRAGRGQGTGQGVAGGSTPKSAAKGFLQTVKRFLSEGVQATPAWIRKCPGGGPADWQNAQVDITAIPGVRKLRLTNGKWQNF